MTDAAGHAAAPAGACATDVWAELARARDRHQGQPAPHWQRIDALARRTQAHSGAVRALLEERLRALLGQLPAPAASAAAPDAQTDAQPTRPDAHNAPPAPSPLRQLLDSLPRHPPPPHGHPHTTALAAPALGELKTVQQHRHTWARLRAAQRLAQARTALPPQAGPMNTQRLLHQALQCMHATSPGYLQHFSTHAEALMWLQAALAPPAPATGTATRKARRR